MAGRGPQGELESPVRRSHRGPGALAGAAGQARRRQIGSAMPRAIPSHPILSADQVRVLEAGLFGGDERSEWKAMLHAGRSTAEAIVRDFEEIGGLPAAARVLVLAGKGNNAGDALIAARELLERFPRASCDILFAFGPRRLRPPALRAWRGLSESCRGRVRSAGADSLSGEYDLCIDGIFGYQFRPPLPAEASAA